MYNICSSSVINVSHGCTMTVIRVNKRVGVRSLWGPSVLSTHFPVSPKLLSKLVC